MTPAELVTAADFAELRAELRGLRDLLGEIRDALPPRYVSIAEAARALGIDRATVVAMLERGEIAGRRAGRRRLVDVASLRAHGSDVASAGAAEPAPSVASETTTGRRGPSGGIR